MSASVRQETDDRNIELGTGVSRPLVIVVIGLGLLVAAAPVALYLLTGSRPLSVRDQAQGQPRVATQSVHANRLPTWVEPNEAMAKRPEPPATPIVEHLLARPAVLQAVQVVEPTFARASARTPPRELDIVSDAKAPPRLIAQRLHPLTEEELQTALARDAKELDLETEKGTKAKLLMKEAPKPAKANAGPEVKNPLILELLATRADLKGLPVRNAAECQVTAQEASAMEKVSSAIGTGGKLYLFSQEGSSSYEVTAQLRACLVSILEQDGKALQDDASVRMLGQILQTWDVPVRLILVKALAQTKGKAASAALVQRAVFDLSPKVRESAVKALKDRPRDEYRSMLVEALRYPWAPVADRAAEALVALEDCDAADQLVDLLGLPDPRAPFQDKDQKWKAPELVRVNHLSSCLLCHAPSISEKGSVRGVIPDRSKSIPESYCSTADFVRADVTYLRQDFSVMHSVADPGKWPRLQRFDYLVRQRVLSDDEVARLDKPHAAADKRSSYPQREAVLWALRELTGEDAGEWAEDWHVLLTDRLLLRDP
jgi:hypothetical protein